MERGGGRTKKYSKQLPCFWSMVGSWVREESKLWKCENVSLKKISIGGRNGKDGLGGGRRGQGNYLVFEGWFGNWVRGEPKLWKFVYLERINTLRWNGKRWMKKRGLKAFTLFEVWWETEEREKRELGHCLYMFFFLINVCTYVRTAPKIHFG